MPKRTWFSMKAADNGQSAEISIYDIVGYYGVDAGSFRDALAELPDGVTTINLRINSPGGDVYQGVAIHNMLARHPADVIVTVDGMAASIASLIAMSGKEIIMPENSAMLIHNPSGGVYGTADDMDQMAQWLRSIGQGVTNTYVAANRIALPRDQIEAMLSNETWMTAQEAVDKGFADKVVAPSDLTMLFDRESLEGMGLEKTPKALMRQDAPAAKWVAVADAAINLYREDDPADFSAAAASASILDACGFKDGTTPDPTKARAGFLFHNETAPAAAASYRFPLVTMVDGKMMITAKAIDAAATAIEAATDIDDGEKVAAGATIASHRQALAILKANGRSGGDPAQRLAVAADATRSKEILAACELANVSAKQAREFVDGGKSLEEVRALLLAAGTGGPGGGSEINPHNPGSGGGNDPDPAKGWAKSIDRLNAQRMPRQRAHA